MFKYYGWVRLVEFFLGASIKDVRSREGIVQCAHFAGNGGVDSSDVDVRTFWCKKTLIFWNLCYVRTGEGDWAIADKGRERVNFSRFSADVRMDGRPPTTKLLISLSRLSYHKW